MFVLFVLFKNISTFWGYLMPNLSFYNWEDVRVHTLLKGICTIGNVITRLEFELTYHDSTIQLFNNFPPRIYPYVVC